MYCLVLVGLGIDNCYIINVPLMWNFVTLQKNAITEILWHEIL